MKKVLSVVLCVVMLFSLAATASAAKLPVLQFNDNGEFKILHLADCQDTYPAHKEMITFICETLDTYKPDLVVLGGDNTTGPKETKREAIAELVKPFVDREVFFTLVFGNHDHEQGVDDNTLLDWYQYYGQGYCLAYDANPLLTGEGTHCLTVMSNKNILMPAYNLYMFDSNTYVYDEEGNELGYGCVEKDQIDWYKANTQLTTRVAGKVVPAMAFQHIIVGDIMDAVYPKVNFSLGKMTKKCDYGNYFIVGNLGKNGTGMLNEFCCPGYYNRGQLDAFAEMKDVVAVFSGHDHTNDFCVNIKGIDVVNTPGASFQSYGETYTRGGRLITIHEGKTDYESEMILVTEMANKEDSKILDGSEEISKLDCVFAPFSRWFVETFFKIWSIFSFGK